MIGNLWFHLPGNVDSVKSNWDVVKGDVKKITKDVLSAFIQSFNDVFSHRLSIVIVDTYYKNGVKVYEYF